MGTRSFSLIKRDLKMIRFILCPYEKLELFLRNFLYSLSPLFLVEYLHIKQRGRIFNPWNPQTFDQKLLWLMLYWRYPLKTRCADKYAVRSYVEEQGLGHILPDLLGVYANCREIDFSKLPEKYVLKCTHGWGFNVFCNDRDKFNTEEAKSKLDSWMKMDISKFAGEVHYALIMPRIICEACLDDLSGGPLIDYKVFCFDGKAHCTMVCTERGPGSTKFDFYDRDWSKKLPYCRSSLLADRVIPKPAAYDDIIGAAETLAKPFPFVRVDFYCVKGKAVFGEMTFTPNGSIDKDLTDLAQFVFGQLIRLPGKYPDPRC
jgi:hypothetical protein